MADVYEYLSDVYDEDVTKKSHYTTIEIPTISLDGATEFKIRSEFQYRPDLISLEFYGTIEYDDYITFANKLQDPIKDYYAGKTVYIPTIVAITEAIGS
jgi:hypothetical protein